MKKFIKFWFPLIGYSAIIFYVSSLSHVKIPWSHLHLDKILHISEFVPFGCLLARAWKRAVGIRGYRSVIWLTTAGALLYGISDEVHQMYVPGRYPSALDATVDVVGGIVGAFLYMEFNALLAYWRNKRKG